MAKEVYIVGGLRTPIGKFGGAYKSIHPSKLASTVISDLIERTRIPPESINLVIMGQVIRAGTGMNTARQAALAAGVPEEVDAMNVDMVCASGLTAVITASQYIAAGEYDVVIAGGMESMSYAPFLLPGPRLRWGIKHLIFDKSLPLEDSMVKDGLYDPIYNMVMGEEADRVAREEGIERSALEEVALESHRRAHKAWEQGLIKDTITLVRDSNGQPLLDIDEGIRPSLTPEKLARLPPIFTEEGPHTVGTSSQLSDGAAALVLASGEAVKRLGLEPKGRIVAHAYAATTPYRYAIAPVKVIKRMLEKTGWSLDKVDFWENNEAFAVNTIILEKHLGIPRERLNVHGGAIAVGHPLGMSGARILIELINVLEKHGGSRGMASICHGLGGAAGITIELVV